MKITLELEGTQFKYSVHISDTSYFEGERPQDLSNLGLFVELGRRLETECVRAEANKREAPRSEK